MRSFVGGLILKPASSTTKATSLICVSALLLMTTIWLAAPPAHAHDGPHGCGGPEIIIQGGNPSPFILPIQADESIEIEIEPDAVLTIRGINLPVDTRLHWGVQGLGSELAGKDVQISAGVTTIDVADFSEHARGVYVTKVALFSGPVELCSIPFELNVSGFGGTTAMAATGVAAVAGIGAIAGAPLAANGVNAKLDAKIQVSRRRPKGWRAWVPIPAWKPSIFSTLIGAITGLAISVIMQQAGIEPLSLASAVLGVVAGGGVSFGVGYSLGVIKTFMREPVED